MIEKKLEEVGRLSEGIVTKNPHIIIRGVSKDTRTLEEGNLYIPILGENFDGHDFIQDAERRGAAASLWEKHRPLPQVDMPLILVDNSLLALQTLAKNYRRKINPKVVALTGSNGKTTTKDMLQAILSKKYKTLSTYGNQNNEIGVPLTLLSMNENTELVIVEMGTERFGEIIVLTEIARPDICLITNIGDSHLEELLTKENVAKEKMDIIKGLPSDGIFIYNYDDPYLKDQVEKIIDKPRILSFGQDSQSTHQLGQIKKGSKEIAFTLDGEAYRVPSPGLHQAYNASAAIIVGRELGLGHDQIQEAFGEVQLTHMRNDMIDKGDFTILDDSYKSNPQNLISALDIVYSQDQYQKKILVLGDMLALGKDIDRIHENMASFIDPQRIAQVFLYGDHMKALEKSLLEKMDKNRVHHFSNKEDLCQSLAHIITKGSLVLVKGSRAMKMEEVVSFLSQIDLESM